MERAVERDPTDARNQFNLGALYENAGRWEEAMAAFERAGELGLRSARLHVATAKLHFRMGDPGQARAELEKALALEPGDPEALQLLQVLEQGG
jgi:Flp pilus assembly protein TadD